MAAINDITGDSIRTRDSQAFADKFDAIAWKAEQENKSVFETFYCTRCHIKVMTSNKTCPCCGEKETLKEVS